MISGTIKLMNGDKVLRMSGYSSQWGRNKIIIGWKELYGKLSTTLSFQIIPETNDKAIDDKGLNTNNFKNIYYATR